MLAAYTGEAKYAIVIKFPKYPETNPYRILNENYFATMKNFCTT